jgi:hypothetical protein
MPTKADNRMRRPSSVPAKLPEQKISTRHESAKAAVEQAKLDELRHKLAYLRDTLAVADIFAPAYVLELQTSIRLTIEDIEKQQVVLQRACGEPMKPAPSRLPQ